ncbi:MAG: glycosyltransferase family 1 protein [Candidatus Magasanikbacteria bacterium]
MKKIGIDARMLSSTFGIGRYVEQLVKQLQNIDTKNHYIIFLRKENFDDVQIVNPNFEKVLADIPWYTLEEQKDFLKVLTEHPVDLMHFPHWNVPYFYKGDYVVTLHDLIMYHFPRPEASTLGKVKFWIKDQAHRTLIKHIAKNSKHILTTSNFTAQDLINTLQVSSEKISVVYQAPFEVVKKIEDKIVNVLEKFVINKKFVMYVGSAYPHKNLGKLLEAWHIFNEEKNNDYQLVLVGKNNYFYEKLQEEYFYVQNVIFTGVVSDTELIQLYKSASVYVFPSLYEGFGLPPLEASVYNVPLAVSSASCLPEILLDSALYFDPNNSSQIADVLDTILTDENIRFELRNNAKNNLKRFSLEKFVRETWEVYNKNL